MIQELDRRLERIEHKPCPDCGVQIPLSCFCDFAGLRVQRRIADLEARLAKAEADTKLLDWLEAQRNEYSRWVCDGNVLRTLFVERKGLHRSIGDTAREAIRLAMEKP